MRASLILLGVTLLGAGQTEPPSEPAQNSAPVSLRGQSLFVLGAGDGSATAAERARAAESILNQILAEAAPSTSVTVSPLPFDAGEEERFGLEVGGKEVLQVGPADARSGGVELPVYARELASALETALARERRHLDQQHLLQSISLTVFLGLLAFLGLRWVSDAGRRARVLVEQRLAKVRGLRVRQVVVVSPETLEGTSYALVGIGRVALQVAILYAYAVFALSQFAATQGAIGPLTRALTSPFAALFGHVIEWLPTALLFIAAIYFLRGAFHLTGFLLDRVASGEFSWRWLPRELAAPARPLVRGALVIAVALLFGPLAGAGADALLTRLGFLALGLVTLGLVPTVAAGALGTLALFGRRYRIGEWVAIGGHVGEVIEVGYFDLTLVPLDAGRIRLSHLLLLWSPVRHLPGPLSLEIDLPVDVAADPEQVIRILSQAFESTRPPEIALREVTALAALYRLKFPPGATAPQALPTAVAALTKHGISVGGRRI